MAFFYGYDVASQSFFECYMSLKSVGPKLIDFEGQLTTIIGEEKNNNNIGLSIYIKFDSY